jgi:hypothetical protein
METLLIDISDKQKSKTLQLLLKELDFVKNIKSIKNKSQLLAALQEKEDVKKAFVSRKNKAIAKYL